MSKIARRLAVAALAALGLSACTSDPAFWDAMATGLNDAADDMAWENANCYWAPPPGAPLAANQRFCPGQSGYRDIQMPTSYYTDRYRDARRDHRNGASREGREGRDGHKR